MTVKFERLELFVVTTTTGSASDTDNPIRRVYTFIDPFTDRVMFEFDNQRPCESAIVKLADMVGRP